MTLEATSTAPTKIVAASETPAAPETSAALDAPTTEASAAPEAPATEASAAPEAPTKSSHRRGLLRDLGSTSDPSTSSDYWDV